MISGQISVQCHFQCLVFKSCQGIAQINDLLAGSVHMMNEIVIYPHVKSGKVKAIAVGSTDPNRFHPGMGTMFLKLRDRHARRREVARIEVHAQPAAEVGLDVAQLKVDMLDPALDAELDSMQLNMAALVSLSKLFLPDLLTRRGKLLNVASTAAFQPGPYMAVYFATKAFVLSFTEAIAAELEGTGVQVMALCPGPTASGFQDRAAMQASVLVQGAWAAVLALSGSFDALTDYTVFGGLAFQALAVAAIFVLRRREPDAERPYRAWGYPVVPALYVLATVWLVANTLLATPGRALAGVALIALGLPVYAWLARRAPAAPQG